MWKFISCVYQSDILYCIKELKISELGIFKQIVETTSSSRK